MDGQILTLDLAARGVPDSGEKHPNADARHDQTHQPGHDIEGRSVQDTQPACLTR